jgi:thiamine biosynthesis lipoprotein
MLLLAGCAALPEAETEGRTVSEMLDGPLDTVSTVTLYDWRGGEEPIEAVFALLYDIDARMSAVSGESEIAGLSGQAGTPAAVSGDVFGLIEYAKTVGAETDGAFDITIRPIVSLWGIGTENARVPAQAELDAALLSVGYEGITLDKAASSVTLEKAGMQLDLGGIAKGYACDRAAEILRNANVGHGIIDLGGNVYVLGTKPDGALWQVGIKSPVVGENGYFGVAAARDRAVVTSGVYERFFERDGKRYHHIMDPRTGCPVDNGLLSVTIISASAAQADALSTACFVLGAERGLAYLSALEGAEGIFVSEDLSVQVTPGLRDSFRITDERFQLVD